MLSSLIDRIANELIYQTSRAGGPGGQHVNKVNSKVTLRWNVTNSSSISVEEKDLIINKLGKSLTNDGELLFSSQRYKSQGRNKGEVLGKLEKAIAQAFKIRKKRRATRPTKASINRRIETKKQLSQKKNMRKNPDF